MRFSSGKNYRTTKMRLGRILYGLYILAFISACNSDDDSSNQGSCDDSVIVNSSLYTNGESDIFTINSIEIVGDCLLVNHSASGCNGETWVLSLVDSDAILESSPPQRNLRLIFSNNEACLAFLTAETSFDLSDLQLVDEQEIILNILNTNESISYTY